MIVIKLTLPCLNEQVFPRTEATVYSVNENDIMGINKKLIGAQAIGFILFLLLSIFCYISLSSYSSINRRDSELTKNVELSADLQRLLQKILMPPNDYLITGDKKERRNFTYLIMETATILEKIKASVTRTGKETAVIEEVEKGFIELQQKAMALLSTENPVGNKETSVLMEEMDAFAEKIENDVEKLHDLIRMEIHNHNKIITKINTWTSGVLTTLICISLAGMIFMGFVINRKVTRPLLELTDAVKIVGEGNLHHRVKIVTGDEIEDLGRGFNNMTQSLAENIHEVQEYSEKLKKSNLQLDQNILQLYALYNISKTLATTLEMEKLLNQVVEGISQALQLHRINVMLVNEERTEMHIVAGVGMSDKARESRFKLGEGIYGRIAMTGSAELINNLPENRRFKPTEGIDDDVYSLICAPFKGRGQVIGLINTYRLGGEVFNESSYELLMSTANQIGMALENARLFEKAKILAITDGMTSLYNYRYFTERLNEEFERAKRYKRDISLIMADMDYFKKYNDAHGHPKGDMLLKDFSEILKKVFRDSDIIARYGGEEFVIILIETAVDVAVEVAEKLRIAVESSNFYGRETQPGGRVTISLGVASYTDEIKSADDLVKIADNALYRAKEEGRNRVCA